MSDLEELISDFTLDDEIIEWVEGDNSLELMGYVDLIEGLKKVISNNKPTDLFKISVNNGSKMRVKVNFWGKLAVEHSVKIQDRTIISFLRGRSTVPKVAFRNPNDIVHPIELTITAQTEVKVFELKYMKPVVLPAELRTVKIEDINSIENECYVLGYLKQPFSKILAYGGSYGSGVLVNENFKLPLRIVEFAEDKVNHQKGCYLKILGKPIPSSKAVTEFSIRSLTDIEVIDAGETKTNAELRKMGLRTPKRKHEDDETSTSKRSSPFDE